MTQLANAVSRLNSKCRSFERQRAPDAQRKSGHSEHRPDEEVTDAHERGQPTEARLSYPANGLTVAPQLAQLITSLAQPMTRHRDHSDGTLVYPYKLPVSQIREAYSD